MVKSKGEKNINDPAILLEMYEMYKSNNTNKEISLTSFKNFAIKSFGIYISPYFENRHNSYTVYKDAVEKVKSDIFHYKINLYKSGKLHPQKICKELHDKGLTFDDINNEKFILKTIHKEYPFEKCKEGITIKDSYLKLMPVQGRTMVYKKPPNEIYVINIKGTNIYKIGVSCNTKRRIFDLRAANPFPIDVIHIQKSLFPSELERKIHNHLSDKHIKNEWFKVDDINSVLDIIKKG